MESFSHVVIRSILFYYVVDLSAVAHGRVCTANMPQYLGQIDPGYVPDAMRYPSSNEGPCDVD